MSPREYKQEERYEPSDLIQSGLDHMNAAEELFNSSPSFFDSAGYLAHMGFELLLKAWLLESLGRFPGIHSLTNLVEQLKDEGINIDFSDDENDILKIVDSYEELRYPNPNHGIEVGNDDWERIDRLLDKIWEQMPETFDEYVEAIDLINKNGRVLMKKRKSNRNGE